MSIRSSSKSNPKSKLVLYILLLLLLTSTIYSSSPSGINSNYQFSSSHLYKNYMNYLDSDMQSYREYYQIPIDNVRMNFWYNAPNYMELRAKVDERYVMSYCNKNHFAKQDHEYTNYYNELNSEDYRLINEMWAEFQPNNRLKYKQVMKTVIAAADKYLSVIFSNFGLNKFLDVEPKFVHYEFSYLQTKNPVFENHLNRRMLYYRVGLNYYKNKLINKALEDFRKCIADEDGNYIDNCLLESVEYFTMMNTYTYYYINRFNMLNVADNCRGLSYKKYLCQTAIDYIHKDVAAFSTNHPNLNKNTNTDDSNTKKVAEADQDQDQDVDEDTFATKMSQKVQQQEEFIRNLNDEDSDFDISVAPDDYFYWYYKIYNSNYCKKIKYENHFNKCMETKNDSFDIKCEIYYYDSCKILLKFDKMFSNILDKLDQDSLEKERFQQQETQEEESNVINVGQPQTRINMGGIKDYKNTNKDVHLYETLKLFEEPELKSDFQFLYSRAKFLQKVRTVKSLNFQQNQQSDSEKMVDYKTLINKNDFEEYPTTFEGRGFRALIWMVKNYLNNINEIESSLLKQTLFQYFVYGVLATRNLNYIIFTLYSIIQDLNSGNYAYLDKIDTTTKISYAKTIIEENMGLLNSFILFYQFEINNLDINYSTRLNFRNFCAVRYLKDGIPLKLDVDNTFFTTLYDRIDSYSRNNSIFELLFKSILDPVRVQDIENDPKNLKELIKAYINYAKNFQWHYYSYLLIYYVGLAINSIELIVLYSNTMVMLVGSKNTQQLSDNFSLIQRICMDSDLTRNQMVSWEYYNVFLDMTKKHLRAPIYKVELEATSSYISNLIISMYTMIITSRHNIDFVLRLMLGLILCLVTRDYMFMLKNGLDYFEYKTKDGNEGKLHEVYLKFEKSVKYIPKKIIEEFESFDKKNENLKKINRVNGNGNWSLSQGEGEDSMVSKNNLNIEVNKVETEIEQKAQKIKFKMDNLENKLN